MFNGSEGEREHDVGQAFGDVFYLFNIAIKMETIWARLWCDALA